MNAPAAPVLYRLSACVGLPVQDTAGRRLGRIADLEADSGAGRPPVVRLDVRRGRDVEPLSWTAVRSFDAHRVVVDDTAYAGHTQDGQGLLLARDVLDTQVIDLDGQRVARVGDVDLALCDGVLRPVAVDVGLAPLARRLGLGRLARRLREETIAWEGLYLASGHGHQVTLPHRAADVHRLDHDELMALVGALPPARGAELLATARPGKHADPLAVARAAGRPHRRYRVMRARKRAPS